MPSLRQSVLKKFRNYRNPRLPLISSSSALGPLLLAMCLGLCSCRAPVPRLGDSLSPAGAQRSRALALYAEGVLHLEREDIEGASDSFAAALESDPYSAAAAGKLAGCYLSRGAVDSGLQVFRELGLRHPDSFPVQRWLALLLQLSGEPLAAEQSYLHAIELRPANPDPYVELAVIMLGQGREPEAIALLEQAEQEVGQAYDILSLRAGIHSRMAGEDTGSSTSAEHLSEAIAALEKIPAGNSAHSRHELALVQLYLLNRQYAKSFERIAELQQSGRLAEPLRTIAVRTVLGVLQTQDGVDAELLAELLESYREDADMLEFGADIMTGLDLNAAALEHYRAASELAGVRQDVYLKAALLELVLDPDQASALLSEGLERFPEYPELQGRSARLALADGDYQRAAAAFEKAAAALELDDSKEATSYFIVQHALALRLAGERQRALEMVVRASADEQGFASLLFSFATQILPTERYPELLDMLAHLADASPRDQAIPILIGHCHTTLKDYAAAAERFEQALGMMPGDTAPEALALVRFWHGAALERMGDIEKAAAEFRRCMELAPEFADPYNYMAYMWAEADINLDEARSLIEHALALEPENGAFIDTLGWIDYKQGRYGDALANLQRARELVPNDPTVYDHIGDTHAALGEHAQALAH
jgi:tetratricopeptide (TPR) repeat protein